MRHTLSIQSTPRRDVTAHRAYVGIGANIGDARSNVERAVDVLGEAGFVARRSSLYRTRPWGKTDQPPFVNAVVLLETPRAPRALLAVLADIEQRLGRRAGERWGPRAIDLDLLTYDDLRVDEPGLRLPHRYLPERAFVLVPLAEIDANIRILARCACAGGVAGCRTARRLSPPRSGRKDCGSVAVMPHEGSHTRSTASGGSPNFSPRPTRCAFGSSVREKTLKSDVACARFYRRQMRRRTAPAEPRSVAGRYDQSRSRRDFSLEPPIAG